MTKKRKKDLLKCLDLLDKRARNIEQKVARGLAYNKLKEFLWKLK